MHVRADRALTGVQYAAAVLVSSGRLQARIQRSAPHIILGIVQPAAFSLVVILARRNNAQIDVGTIALAVGLLSLWGATVWQAGLILRQEQRQGTLANILVRSAPLPVVLAGKSLGSTARSAVSIAATVFVVSVVFGDPIAVADPIPFVAAVVAVILSATVLGMLLSCLFLLTRAAARVAEALTYPVFILGNILIPASLLPEVVRPISWAISLHWGGTLLRSSAAGEQQALGDWAGLIGTTTAYAALAAFAFRIVLDRARRRGTLEFF